MPPSLLQAAVMGLALTACTAGPAKPVAATGEKPFVTTSLASFDAPWAMAFLTGSGSIPPRRILHDFCHRALEGIAR